ncbi:MAG TPA: hypothetical protein VHO02_05650 [Fibrobacteria bacterium]|jgi:hypothetical protein|nr:hypothetical protein [Fibrobacteria bacterium]
MTKVKVNWTPEEAHARAPRHSHSTTAWVLWIVAMVLIVSWIASMAMGVKMGGPADVMLLAAAALILICVLMGFRNVVYLEPMRIARERILGSRWMRWSRRNPPGA